MIWTFSAHPVPRHGIWGLCHEIPSCDGMSEVRLEVWVPAFAGTGGVSGIVSCLDHNFRWEGDPTHPRIPAQAGTLGPFAANNN